MKKLLGIILGILFMIPFVVRADMGSPYILGYDASVKDPNGATIYKYVWNDKTEKGDYVDTGTKAAYGTTYTVEWEAEESGYVDITNYDDEDNTDSYYVKLSDLIMIEKEHKASDSELLKPIKVKVIKDVVIKKGPANGYESTNVTIKAGTEINARFFGDYDEEDGSPDYDTSNTWVYVEYNGTKGYIDTYGATVAYKQSIMYTGKLVLITYGEADVVDPVTEKKLTTIKPNTIISEDIYLVDDWSNAYYLKYNGVYGLVSQYSFIDEDEDTTTVTVNKKMNVYASLKENMENGTSGLKTVKTLDANTSFNTKFYNDWDDCRFYYDDGKVKGWVFSTLYDVEDEEGVTTTYCKDITYETPLAEVDCEDDNCNTVGDDIEPNPTISDNNGDDVNDVAVPESKPSTGSKTSPLELIYICIAAAIVLSITIIVVITYVNKNKNTTPQN